MKKLKIAHLTPASIILPPEGDQGRWILTTNLIKEQIKLGHKITIFTNKKSKIPGAKIESIDPITPEEKTPKAKEFARNINNLLLLNKAYLQADKFDIIHSHLNELHLFFAPHVKTPTVVTQHWPIDKKVKKLFEQLPQKNVYVVPISNSQRKQGKGVVNYTQTVYNALDLKMFKFNPKPKDHLIYVSRLVPEKGADIAIKIALAMKQKLILIGKTNDSKKYQDYFNKKIKPYLSNPLIKYLGEKPYREITKYFGQAKAFLFPLQWEEPFGLVLIDSMASGTPVIAFKKGAVPEVVKNNQTGFVVKNEKEMMTAIKKIDTIKRGDCRKRVEECFSLKAMVDGYEKVYQKILNKK